MLVQEDSTSLAQVRLPHGTLITDELVAELAGNGEVIDLEREIYHLEVDDMPAIQVSRLRDLARLLRRLNTCGSRHEAVYLLRFLVARLCSASYRGVPGAKNLRPEIARVRNELAEFMNGPFAPRLRLPTRILVRSISGLVSRPKLIDEVWQDTIDLSEVHVRGSASPTRSAEARTTQWANRRSSWRAPTCNGCRQAKAISPTRNGRSRQADEAARSNDGVVELVARIVQISIN